MYRAQARDTLDKLRIENKSLNFSEYIGGEFKSESNANKADIALVYPTQGWSSKQATAFQIAALVLGDFDSFEHHVQQPFEAKFDRAHTQSTPPQIISNH